MPVKTGFIHGTGNALNVEIGFVPDYVKLIDWTNGDIITEGFMKRVIVFTSLSTAIRTGMWIKGRTSGARARILQVIIDSGTVAAGDAEGWLICNVEDVIGTLETEEAQVYATDPGAGASPTDHLDIVVDTELGITTALAVAPTTTAATQVNAYGGTEGALRKGFTVGGTVSINDTLFFYIAIGSDQGQGGEELVAGESQSSDAGVWA